MCQKIPKIIILPSGPIIAVDVPTIENLQGTAYASKSVTTLCRCGDSTNKPFCDGAHSKKIEITRNRKLSVKKKIKKYIGTDINIFFDPNICSHSGLCIRKLPLVFNTKHRPWINVNEGTVKDIIEVVGKCPSGSLSYGFGDIPHCECKKEEAKIVIVKNGPFNIIGRIQLKDDFHTISSNDQHYCLCRCGKSKNQPFCDGTHIEENFISE